MARAVCSISLGLRLSASLDSLCVRSIGQRSPAPRFRSVLWSSAAHRYIPAASMSSAPTIFPPPEHLLWPLDFPHKVLMGPGPSNASPRVLAAGAMPLLGHLHTEFFEILDEVKEGIQYAFQTKNEWTYAISGSGHAAMEAAAFNLLEEGDVALVCRNGFWGHRFAEMVERNGSKVETLVRPFGEVFSLDEIEEALKKHKPVLMFITQGESSGGTAQPLEGLGPLCHKYNCLLVVDSVAALGGIPMFMDAWEIDCLYSGSQKVLGAPPGTAPISYSERAKKRVLTRSTKPRSFYLDAIELANYWGCDDQPRRYHHTAPISGIYALRESFSRLGEIGLESSWAMHKLYAEQLWKGLEELGLEMLVKDPALRNPCVTAIKIPDGVPWKDVCAYAMKNHKVEIAGGLGEMGGKIWRIGVMGYNCTSDRVTFVLRAFSDSLVNCGYKLPK